LSSEIVREVTYPHPPELVWQALTRSEAIADWLMENDFRPAVGHRFTLRMDPKPGFDGIVRCEVLEVAPPRRLRYSWLGGWVGRPTEVSWELAPVPGGTRVTLRHAGFNGLGGLAIRPILGPGWSRVLSRGLRDHLAWSASEARR
jgi:uncharacterized protein YndB with AHSA1/START domain